MTKRVKRAGRRRERPGLEPEQVLYFTGSAETGRRVRVEGSEADHAVRSLRVRSGDHLVLVDGRGRRMHGTVVDLGRHTVDVEIGTIETVANWPHRELWFGAGVLRSTRMDVLVEKASELGVARFIPIVMKRSVARPDEGAKLERWRRIAVESLKQSKRAVLMEVAEPVDWESWVASLDGVAGIWVADPAGEAPADVAVPAAEAGPWLLMVGPEGGVAPEERSHLDRRGASFICLGGNRLRAETAGLTLVATFLSAAGELGAG